MSKTQLLYMLLIFVLCGSVSPINPINTVKAQDAVTVQTTDTTSIQVPVSEKLRRLPVQDGGRIKPYDSFAREVLKLIYGKETFQGKSAENIIFTWMIIPDHWDKTPFVQVRHNGLREALKLDKDKTQVYYSPKELFENERIGLLIQELHTKVQAQEKLNPYFQAVQTLENQLSLYHALKMREALRVAPSVVGDRWQSVAELNGELKIRFEAVIKAFVQVITSTVKIDSTSSDALSKGVPGASVSLTPPEALAHLDEAIESFEELARNVQPNAYSNQNKIEVEVHLNTFHPFKWAWIAYLIGSLFLFGSLVNQRSWLYQVGWGGAVIGFGLHLYGMIIRSYILGRPPVSNMYETVVWVPWGVVAFSFFFEWSKRSKTILMISSLIATFCLILTDLAPAVLDKSLQPLQPVLRDNFWLMTHVLIIALSYGAFFLAFGLGNLQLYYFLSNEKKWRQQIHNDVQTIYRSIQVGVVLLGGGIILGGIWADYSWGRFWGWDPKETWALIAWLGYLAILHGRLVGWVRPFGMAVCSVVAFTLVIMAWYGVNFVLGAGLHSYGFGAGGVEYVAAFVALNLLWVIFVSAVRYSRKKEQDTTDSSS